MLHHNNAPSHTSVFTRGIFTNSNMACVPNTSFVTLFSRLKIKLEGRHFGTSQGIEVEPQAVLNALTEHNLQGAFTNNGITANGGELLRALWWQIGPKLVFDHNAAPVPEIMDNSLYSCLEI
jgi:hypothetical protein